MNQQIQIFLIVVHLTLCIYVPNLPHPCSHGVDLLWSIGHQIQLCNLNVMMIVLPLKVHNKDYLNVWTLHPGDLAPYAASEDTHVSDISNPTTPNTPYSGDSVYLQYPSTSPNYDVSSRKPMSSPDRYPVDHDDTALGVSDNTVTFRYTAETGNHPVNTVKRFSTVTDTLYESLVESHDI